MLLLLLLLLYVGIFDEASCCVLLVRCARSSCACLLGRWGSFLTPNLQAIKLADAQDLASMLGTYATLASTATVTHNVRAG